MDDIKRQDQKILLKELFQPWRVLCGLGLSFMWITLLLQEHQPFFLIAFIVTLATYLNICWNAAERKKFTNKRLETLWNGCKDRHKRFEDVLKRLRKDQIADLQEMPATVKRVGVTLYAALRRADVIMSEIHLTEKGLYNQPPVWAAAASDPQSKELYRLADKNIAEYRAQFAGVLAGVQRTEAQSAVYMTTLDTLRMKMLGYRLVGRSPEMNSTDFLTALAEARGQLQSIDQALEELDLSHYPTTIASVPPPMPASAIEDTIERLRQQQ